MSRCFPYPPPGYSRNGATYEALIESIKLQKENEKAKAERKKEKRAKKEKKEKKEKKKELEKSKLEKNPTESQQGSQYKKLQTSSFKEQSLKKVSTIEQLEKSDVTEEHGQPVDSHKPSYSSDSTQNSNKRKREDPVVPDDSSNVKPFKIRLFKKQKEHDSIKEPSCSDSGRIGQQIGQQNLNSGQDAQLVQSTSKSVNEQKTANLVSRNRKTGIPSTSTSYDIKKDDVAVVHPSRQPVPIRTFRRQSKVAIPVPIPIPAPVSIPSSVTRNNDAKMVSSSGRTSINEIKVGPTQIEKKKDSVNEIPLKVEPTRFEKKLKKKHLKYEKLIGGWVPPPVVEAQVSVGGDNDWLMGSGKTMSARSAVRDDVETCREMMWQPCARFLVEADVYALPYTVPF